MFRRPICSSKARSRAIRTLAPKSIAVPTRSTHSASAPKSISKNRPAAATAPKRSTQLSDVLTQSIAPLYVYGWRLKSHPIKPENRPKVHGILKRDLEFSNFQDWAAFAENLRNVPTGDLSLFPTLKGTVRLHSPEGVTRRLIQSALETETAYRAFVGGGGWREAKGRGYYDVVLMQVRKIMDMRDPNFLDKLYPDTRVNQPLRPSLIKIEPVSLPLAPPIPASPAPALTNADLETYVAPLIGNGWMIRGMMEPTVLGGRPSLTREFYFNDNASARQFLSAVVGMIPVPRSNRRPLAGVGVHLYTMEAPKVVVASLSAIAASASHEAGYGPSLADVRFAIELENEVAKNWAGRVDTTSAPRNRFVPKTTEDLWTHKLHRICPE
ncbi:hypothetical protein DFH07DRAFT_943071 [Mycena maculata]|uniref:Uncharacterized protein n=1 Tax=Mycena maculata TaxID=230809 RepID=A0AAD7N3S9_9AGAR|nr:hypothetical protein DFH07DRAFT_943071 [Mycena maculata]